MGLDQLARGQLRAPSLPSCGLWRARALITPIALLSDGVGAKRPLRARAGVEFGEGGVARDRVLPEEADSTAARARLTAARDSRSRAAAL